MEERELPAGWVEVDLSEVCTKIVDGSHNPPKASLSGLPMLSARNVENRGISLEADYRLIARDDFEVENRRTQISNGDVLLTIVGAIGRTAVVPEELLPFTLQRSVAVLKPNPGISSQYLAYALESPLSQKYLVDNAKGTAQKGIYLKTLGGLRLRVSPFNEQRRIAAKLDTTLAAVESCRQRLDGVAELLKRFRQAVLAAATSGELTREWREERGATQHSWRTIKTKEAGKIQLGRQRSPKYHHGPTMRPYLRVQNVFEDRIDLDDVMEMDFSGADLEKYTLYPGDILLNEGQSPQYLGRPAMYRGELPGACFTNSLIRFQAGDSVLPDFALLVFRHSMHSGRYVEKGTITTNIAHLSAGRFGEVDFPLPPLTEQQEIVRRAQELFTLADQLEARLHSARRVVDRLTPALLAKAFRGELVPQDPSDEPASALLERIRAARQAETAAGKPSRRGRKKAPAHPDPTSPGLDSKPAAVSSDPTPPDQLAMLLQECGPLSEKALLAASELEPGSFLRQLQLELQAGTIREALEEGERVLVGG